LKIAKLIKVKQESLGYRGDFKRNSPVGGWVKAPGAVLDSLLANTELGLLAAAVGSLLEKRLVRPSGSPAVVAALNPATD